jgi:hypothetical protein
MNSEHFTDAELACPCCGVNLCVDKLVQALEALRAVLGKPISVDSGYRCAKHNKAVNGEPNSRHLQGMAADIRVADMTPVEVYRAAKEIPAFGGFGVALHFVHLDVRTTVAKWGYGADGKQCPWDKSLDEVVA